MIKNVEIIASTVEEIGGNPFPAINVPNAVEAVNANNILTLDFITLFADANIPSGLTVVNLFFSLVLIYTTLHYFYIFIVFNMSRKNQ